MDSFISLEKSKLRQEMRRLRSLVAQDHGENWGPAERDRFFQNLSQWDIQFSGPVLSFFPVGSEPNLLPTEGYGSWFFPKVEGDDLSWFLWSVNDALPPLSQRGLREAPCGIPISEVVALRMPILCFVPALAVDARGYRLGYGGGFYDRFLARSQIGLQLLTVSVIHSSLLIAELPKEEHDIPVDVFVTESGVTEIKPGQILRWLRGS